MVFVPSEKNSALMFILAISILALIVLFDGIEAFSVYKPKEFKIAPLKKSQRYSFYDVTNDRQRKSFSYHMKIGDEGEDTQSIGADDKEIGKDLFFIEEPKLLVGDLISMLLTCQLLGLLDILNKPEFWMNGGFAQPIDLSLEGVSTLGTLVKRDSIMSISWVLSAIKNQGYSISAVIDDMTAVKCALTIFTDYCSLLIIFTLTIAFTMSAPVDAFEILRQSYFTILMLGAFRVVYGRFALFL